MLQGKTITQSALTYAMKHIDHIRWAIISCVILFFVTMVLIWTNFINECAVVCAASFMLAGVVLYAIHQPASRFRELMDGLKPNLLDVEWVHSKTLKFTTANLGEFYVKYNPEEENESAYYLVWITSDKGGPSPIVSRMTLWKRPYKSILGKWLYFDSPPYIPVISANDIKNLKWIVLEMFGSQYRIIARLSDEWLHSETDDLLKTVELLEEIYAGM
jgi:hypothetical protein